jgi:RNA polymerase-binding transcription factor DksA
MASDAPATDYLGLLEAEGADLRHQLAELGGLNYDSNFADSSQVTAERSEAEALTVSLNDALHDVEAAIARLADGSYGRCRQCGQPIAPARLEAVPTAQLCMACASRH